MSTLEAFFLCEVCSQGFGIKRYSVPEDGRCSHCGSQGKVGYFLRRDYLNPNRLPVCERPYPEGACKSNDTHICLRDDGRHDWRCQEHCLEKTDSVTKLRHLC